MPALEWQRRIDAIRLYVATATAGIAFGAALTILLPMLMSWFPGLEHPDQMIGIKSTLFAAAVSLVARWTRINIRRRK